MEEHRSSPTIELGDELLDLLQTLLHTIRTDTARYSEAESEGQEWRDIAELRATSGQIRLLRIVIARQRCTMQALAEALDVAQPSVTAMIKRLLTQGFVERGHDEQDWRVVWISATERGERAVTLYNQLRRASLQRRLAHIDPQELEQLRAALPVLRHILEVTP